MLTLNSTYRVRKATLGSQNPALVYVVLTLSHRENTSQSSPINVLTTVLQYNHLLGQSNNVHSFIWVNTCIRTITDAERNTHEGSKSHVLHLWVVWYIVLYLMMMSPLGDEIPEIKR